MWALGSTDTIHLRLIGKRVVDFLFVLIKLFLLPVTAEALRENIESHCLFATAKRFKLVHLKACSAHPIGVTAGVKNENTVDRKSAFCKGVG